MHAWWRHVIQNFSPFTPPFNTIARPAIMLPLWQARAGLPLAMQFAGRLGDEETLYSLAGQLEQALPWSERQPGGPRPRHPWSSRAGMRTLPQATKGAHPMNPAFEAMYAAEYAREMHAAGLWRNELLLSSLDRALCEAPERIAIVDHNSMTGVRTVLSYRALKAEVDRIAVGLARLGVQRGDVVSFQLPNWWQFTALHLACLSLGAISNPLMPIFRERELGFMLELAEARVLVVPRLFRGFDYPAMADALRVRLPALEHVLVIDGRDARAFERVLPPLAPDTDVEALLGGRRPHADEIIELMYTSGTTGEPKGVMHTSNTTFSNVRTFAERLRLGPDDVFLMASPMSHQTGFLYGIVMAIDAAATACYQDIWEPAKATDIIAREGVTFTMGSTPFLADLADAAERWPDAFATLETFVSAGAPIPRALVRRARDGMGASILSAWGMTEIGAVTLTAPEAPAEKAFETDGNPLPGFELRIAATDGASLPAGQEGRLLARGCSMFAGYLKRPQLYAFDAAGWFDTGDLARLDAEGYIRITGRAKDLIIRGGENIPVVEIENLLYQHPAILEAAIVGMPDPRLGERACAFLVTKDGAALPLAAITEWLGGFNVSRSYWPERVECLDALPRTPSGKIQKFQLRELAARLGVPGTEAAGAASLVEHGAACYSGRPAVVNILDGEATCPREGPGGEPNIQPIA